MAPAARRPDPARRAARRGVRTGGLVWEVARCVWRSESVSLWTRRALGGDVRERAPPTARRPSTLCRASCSPSGAWSIALLTPHLSEPVAALGLCGPQGIPKDNVYCAMRCKRSLPRRRSRQALKGSGLSPMRQATNRHGCCSAPTSFRDIFWAPQVSSWECRDALKPTPTNAAFTLCIARAKTYLQLLQAMPQIQSEKLLRPFLVRLSHIPELTGISVCDLRGG